MVDGKSLSKCREEPTSLLCTETQSNCVQNTELAFRAGEDAVAMLSGHVHKTWMSLGSPGERSMGARRTSVSEPVDAVRG